MCNNIRTKAESAEIWHKSEIEFAHEYALCSCQQLILADVYHEKTINLSGDLQVEVSFHNT